MTTQTPAHRTLPGGSIDYGHYVARAHAIRSEDAHGIVRAATHALRKLRLKGATSRQTGHSVCLPQVPAS